MSRQPLTAENLDAMLVPQRRSSLAAECLWGASSIAAYMGISDDTVRRLAREGEAPIRIKGGRYFSTRTEITKWLMAGSDESDRWRS